MLYEVITGNGAGIVLESPARRAAGEFQDPRKGVAGKRKDQEQGSKTDRDTAKNVLHSNTLPQIEFSCLDGRSSLLARGLPPFRRGDKARRGQVPRPDARQFPVDDLQNLGGQVSYNFV